MKMQILNLIQGSDEWKASRFDCCTASEAPIMMGASPYMSRDDLLKYKTTGDEQEVSRFQQIIFDKGHLKEAIARPIAEQKMGEDLFPITGLLTIDGIKFLASFDGITAPFYDNHWEHKQFNRELFELVKSGGELEPKHYWQLEHQLLVNGNDSCVFAVSDGTEANYADMVYHSRPERREQLILGWKQFLADLVDYQPIFVAPKAIAEPVATLPTITFKTEFKGNRLELTSNLEIYKVAAGKLVEQSKKKIETDQDFANAEARIKACKDAEERIEHIKAQVLGEVADIDMFTRDLSAIADMLRQCRLNEDKQVKSRKEQIRLEVINNARAEFDKHIAEINKNIALENVSFSTVALPAVYVDFASAIKGKKTVKSLIESANDELARGKIEANRVAAIITANLYFLSIVATGYDGLFADIQQLVVKDREALEAIAKQRIAAHKENEQKKIQAEAQRIADEQIAKEKAADAKRLADEQAAIDFNARQALAVSTSTQAAVTSIGLPSNTNTQQSTLNTGAELTGSRMQRGVIANQYESKAAQSDAGFSQEQAPEQQKTEYQLGLVKGLELALNIFTHCQRNGSSFEKAINEFMASDSIPKIEQAA